MHTEVVEKRREVWTFPNASLVYPGHSPTLRPLSVPPKKISHVTYERVEVESLGWVLCTMCPVA
eukprot:2321216-Amphidinium_carterae.1